MTNTASLKFRLGNNMVLSSTANGSKNYKNPSGSPEAGDSSTGSKCRGQKVHRLKPVITKPNARAAAGMGGSTKYFLFICIFSVALIICDKKYKISQHRQLMPKSYKTVDHLPHLRAKLNGKFKKIVGGKFGKSSHIADEIYSRLDKWEGNANKLMKVVVKGDKTVAEKEDLKSQINDIKMSISVLKDLISGVRQRALPKNDSELISQIISGWLIYLGPGFRQAHKASGNVGVLQIIDNLLLEQIKWLFENGKIQTVEHVSDILKAINKEKFQGVISVEFTLMVLRMPEFEKLLMGTEKIAGKSSFVSEFRALLMKLAEMIPVAQMNANYDCIREVTRFMVELTKCNGILMHEEALTQVICDTGNTAQKALAFQHDYQEMLESLRRVQEDKQSKFYGESFDIDLTNPESCKLAFRIYAYNWAYPVEGKCPEPRLRESNFEKFLMDERTHHISESLVRSWVAALKKVHVAELEYLADPNIGEPKFWVSGDVTAAMVLLDEKKACVNAERLKQEIAKKDATVRSS